MGRLSKWIMGGALTAFLVASVVASSPAELPASKVRKERSGERVSLPKLGPAPAPPRCKRAYLIPPELAVPDVREVRDVPWFKIQEGPCVYADRDDSRDFSLRDGRVGQGFGCNFQSGAWKAHGRRFTTHFLATTSMMCDEEVPYGDLNAVVTWGMSSGGRLYLLDRSGNVEIVLAPATMLPRTPESSRSE